MRCGIHGWVVLAALWAGHAGAVDAAGADDAWADVGNCAEGQALLQRQPQAGAQYRAFVEQMCEFEAAQPRHDAPTQAAIQQWHRDHVVAIGRHVRTLLASRDPHDQVAAALLLPLLQAEALQGRPQRVSEWSDGQVGAAFARARQLAPDDQLVAWLEVLACPGLGAASNSGCEPQAALARLQRLQPDNAAVWLHQLAADATSQNRVATLLATAAQSTRYEIPFAATGRLLATALAQVEGPTLPPHVAAALGRTMLLGRPATRRDFDGVTAMAIAQTLTLPAAATWQACFGPTNEVAQTLREPCIAIYTLISQENPSILISQKIALTRLVQLTVDTPAGSGWHERRREHQWVSDNGAALMQRGMPEDYLDTVWRDGELAAVKGLLQAAGVPLAPPQDWVPDGENARGPISGRELRRD